MARIAGVDIPNNKRICTSLTYLFGIGDHNAMEICKKASIDPELKTRVRSSVFLTRNIPWKVLCAPKFP